MMKTKVLSKQTVSTAIFEYLQTRGFHPNRKHGVWYPEDFPAVVVQLGTKKRRRAAK